ncbi:MAG: 50S ribosomal protein L18 [Candidatus Aenigmarchaeota archaeon]|nr:50S ribosomal protein L18 [Candidatus Aenigmarchaeota archaeon]
MPKFGPRYKMPLKRRRKFKTDYKKRLKLLLSGKPRLVVRRTNKYIIAQMVVSEEGEDKTIVGITSKVLRDKYGWKYSCKNLPAAYLTGLLIGKLALEKGIKEAILDIGLHRKTKGNRLFATLKGAVDAGLSVPHGEEILPDESRIKGEHIASYLEKFKNLPQDFETVKKKIIGG